MPTATYRNLISKYIADDLSLEDTEELLEWLNQDPANDALLKEMQGVWDKTRDYPEKLSVDTQNAWLKVKRSILTSKSEQCKKKQGFFSIITQTWSTYVGSIYRRFT
jgi:hypothetical protein